MHFPRYELFSSDFWSSDFWSSPDTRQTESDSYEPTVQSPHVGSKERPPPTPISKHSKQKPGIAKDLEVLCVPTFAFFFCNSPLVWLVCCSGMNNVLMLKMRMPYQNNGHAQKFQN